MRTCGCASGLFGLPCAVLLGAVTGTTFLAVGVPRRRSRFRSRVRTIPIRLGAGSFCMGGRSWRWARWRRLVGRRPGSVACRWSCRLLESVCDELSADVPGVGGRRRRAGRVAPIWRRCGRGGCRGPGRGLGGGLGSGDGEEHADSIACEGGVSFVEVDADGVASEPERGGEGGAGADERVEDDAGAPRVVAA